MSIFRERGLASPQIRPMQHAGTDWECPTKIDAPRTPHPTIPSPHCGFPRTTDTPMGTRGDEIHPGFRVIPPLQACGFHTIPVAKYGHPAMIRCTPGFVSCTNVHPTFPRGRRDVRFARLYAFTSSKFPHPTHCISCVLLENISPGSFGMQDWSLTASLPIFSPARSTVYIDSVQRATCQTGICFLARQLFTSRF